MRGKSEAAMREHGGGGLSTAGNRLCVHYDMAHSPRQGPTHGRVVGDTWHKVARASVHMMRTPRGWAVDAEDLTLAERAGCKMLCIRDQEQSRCFWATLETIHRRGFPVNRGHGEQVALTLAHWSPTRGEAEMEPTAEPERETVKQGALW